MIHTRISTNRIFMVKMCIIVSVVTGVNYFSDSVSCIIANSNGMEAGFVGSACWIQGFYIYKPLKHRLDESGYYGIPRNMDYDGVNSLNQLCSTENRALDAVPGCKPMEKLYYLQYQYMPFFMAALAIFFYFPYIIFRVTNTDLVSLKDTLKCEVLSPDLIVKNYFNYRINSKRKMRYRVAMNIVVKILYVVANVVVFLITDHLLNGDFSRYGMNWAKWSTVDNMKSNNHDLREREEAKPGNILLPPMGFCDIHEASRDIRNTFINRHKFICEISPHVLYQYAFIVMWFVLVFGIILSVIGFIVVLFGHAVHITCFITNGDSSRQMYKILTLREVDYLQYIRRKNLPLYGEVIRQLTHERHGLLEDEKEQFL